jgi:hypothetical protein
MEKGTAKNALNSFPGRKRSVVNLLASSTFLCENTKEYQKKIVDCSIMSNQLSTQKRRYIALPMYNGSNNGVGAAIFGNGGCNYANWNWLGNNNGNRNSNAFRCVH